MRSAQPSPIIAQIIIRAVQRFVRFRGQLLLRSWKQVQHPADPIIIHLITASFAESSA